MKLNEFNSLTELFFYQANKQNPKNIFLEWINPNNKKFFTWSETVSNIYKLTKTLKEYQKKLSKKLYSKYKLNKKSFVIDIGSNDGTLLEGFKKKTKILGVEPTNTAKIANKNGIKTIQNFINEGLAKRIVKKYGQADLITATNVFAHMADLGKVLRSIEILLNDNGHFVLENHYLLDIIKDLQFDSIYHEHVRTYSLKPIIKLFSFYDLKVIKVERASRYGGNIRVHVAKNFNEKTESFIIFKYFFFVPQNKVFQLI